MKRKINQCNGKVGYTTLTEANKHVTNLNSRGGKKVKSYLCSECGKYHYGHQSKRKLFMPNDKYGTIPPFH